LTIGLQGGQPRGAYAAKRRSPMNVSSFADTFLLLLRLRHYRVVHSVTLCPVETRYTPNARYFYKYPPVEVRRVELLSRTLFTRLHTTIKLFIDQSTSHNSTYSGHNSSNTTNVTKLLYSVAFFLQGVIMCSNTEMALAHNTGCKAIGLKSSLCGTTV
jgi:hypothetical protein